MKIDLSGTGLPTTSCVTIREITLVTNTGVTVTRVTWALTMVSRCHVTLYLVVTRRSMTSIPDITAVDLPRFVFTDQYSVLNYLLIIN